MVRFVIMFESLAHIPLLSSQLHLLILFSSHWSSVWSISIILSFVKTSTLELVRWYFWAYSLNNLITSAIHTDVFSSTIFYELGSIAKSFPRTIKKQRRHTFNDFSILLVFATRRPCNSSIAAMRLAMIVHLSGDYTTIFSHRDLIRYRTASLLFLLPMVQVPEILDTRSGTYPSRGYTISEEEPSMSFSLQTKPHRTTVFNPQQTVFWHTHDENTSFGISL